MVEIREINSNKRTWNDSKKEKKANEFDSGQFKAEEVKTLMEALCLYVKANGLGEVGLIDLCSKSKEELSPELKGAWCRIAESLPLRTV